MRFIPFTVAAIVGAHAVTGRNLQFGDIFFNPKEDTRTSTRTSPTSTSTSSPTPTPTAKPAEEPEDELILPAINDSLLRLAGWSSSQINSYKKL